MTDGIDGFIHLLCEAESAIQTRECEEKNPRKESPEMTPTEKKIWEMMTENTGCHILDSGGASGRAWQQNRKIEDPREIPAVSLEVWDDDVIIQYNLFPFLTNILLITEESEALQKRFWEFSHSDEMEDESWYTCIAAFIEHIEDEITWSHGENTYNYENLLGGVIQYDILEMEDCNNYIILQTHNGCDVRGGYSTPYIFEITDLDHFHLAMVDVSCGCDKCHGLWSSDDCGYHWYGSGWCDDSLTKRWRYGRKDGELHFDTDPDEDKVYHKNCGGEIEFFVMVSY